MENRLPRCLIVVLAGWLLCVASLSAADTSAEPRLESGGLKILRAVVLHLQDTADDEAVLRLSLFVQNVSEKELAVVTGNTVVTIMNHEVPLYQMGFDTQQGYKGVALVPSIYRYYPLTLRPGEGTVITTDYPLYPTWRTVGKSIEGKEGMHIAVGYTITSPLAERFNLWQGTLVSEPVYVQPARRTPPTPEEIAELHRRFATERQKSVDE